MKRQAIYLFVVLGLLIGFTLFSRTNLLRDTRGVAWYAWVNLLGHWLDVGTLELSSDVESQLKNLRAENVRLRSELRDYPLVREQLGSPSFEGFEAIKGELAARPVDRFHAQYILNRGTRDGVSLGSPVVVNGSNLVGFVSELNRTTCVVQLIFHPSTSIPVEVMAEEKSGRALVRGKSFTGVSLEALPHGILAQKGDSVVTLSDAMLVPQGLLIGTIDTISSEENEPYQRARLRIPFSQDDLRYVQILVVP